MEEKESQRNSVVHVDDIERTTHYLIGGSYGSYTFQAQVCDSGRSCCSGIDDGCICVLSIKRIKEVNGHTTEDMLFDYDYGWNAESEEEEDVNAYREIYSFLEDLPPNRINE